VRTAARPLPILTINVGLSWCIATTGFAAKTSLARGREKRTKVRPVKIAVKASPQTISVDAIKWPYDFAGYISP
jgi:hypothetical protein